MMPRPVAAIVLLAAAAAASRVAAAEKPPALYQSAQAAAGAKVYAANCAGCHGMRLEGSAGPALAGPKMRTRAKDMHLLVGDTFSVIARHMPLDEPASLSRGEYVEIMAYVLKANGYPGGPSALTYDGAMRSKATMTSYAGE